MSTNYVYKGPEQKAYNANKKRLRVECTILLDSILNEVLNEMTLQFNEELADGRILEFKGSENHVKELLRIAAGKELGSGDAK